MVGERSEEAEAQLAQGSERLVGTKAFGELLAMSAENTVALMKLGSDALDLVVRNLRIAGRRDVTRLAQQIARTEDKLERVLQEIELLRAEQQQRSDSSGERVKTAANGSAARKTRAAKK